MRKDHHIVAFLALLACLLPPVLTGCGKDSLSVEEKVSIPLFLSVNDVSEGVGTKMLDKVVQVDNPQTFRGIQNFFIIPFCIAKESSSNNVREVVWDDDPCFDDNIQLSSKLNQYDFSGTGATKGFYSGGSFVNNLTNAVLVYGEAKEESSETLKLGPVAFKQRNGVIVPNEKVQNRSGGVKARELTFDLEPMISGDQSSRFNTWKTAHLGMLNAIASATSGTATFKEPSTYENDATLSAAFRAFSGEGKIFSSADLPLLLTNLYRICSSMPSGATTLAKAVANQICIVMDGYKTGSSPLLVIAGTGADTYVSMTQSAKVFFGLPEGAIVFQWGEMQTGLSGSGFGSPDKSEGVNIAPITDYCFPPALWYYSNGPMMGNTIGGMESHFSDRSRYSTWDDIVNATNSSGAIYTRGITLDSKAALIREPLQYGVSLLALKLNGPYPADLRELSDKKGKKISIQDQDFPFTGIIFGGQRTQNFDFTASDANMRFVYDSDVYDETDSPKGWISSDWPSETIYTLAFTTRKQEDVFFALEFINNSGESFTGAQDCTILPGSKFYLVGKMDYSNLTAEQKAKQASVFAKDHITTLTVQFESLSGAYSILPELATPDLQMGVSAKLNWDILTPYSNQLQ